MPTIQSAATTHTINTILDSRILTMNIKKYQYSDTSTDTVRNQYTDFVKRHGPFKYFFTLTFPKRQSDDDCTKQINYLFFLLNKKIFRNYPAKYLTGFCMYERHRDFWNNSIHCHGVICDDPNLEPESKPSFIDHFWHMINNKKVSITRNYEITTEPAFRPKCCDITVPYNDDVAGYLTKTIRTTFNYEYFKPITSIGI